MIYRQSVQVLEYMFSMVFIYSQDHSQTMGLSFPLTLQNIIFIFGSSVALTQ